MRMP